LPLQSTRFQLLRQAEEESSRGEQWVPALLELQDYMPWARSLQELPAVAKNWPLY